MRTIYIDEECKCHVTDDGSMRAVETAFFDGKCDEFIEGYRYIPAGETWTREDGEVFSGEMISPWQDYNMLALAQSQYELAQAKAEAKQYETVLTEAEAAYQEGVNSI